MNAEKDLLPEPFFRGQALTYMDSLGLIAFFAIYLVLQIWVLPRFGVRT